MPGDAFAQGVARLGQYVCARRRLLDAIARPRSNRDPFAEWAEWLAAEVMHGTRAINPVQTGYDVELPDGVRVQVKYLANTSDGNWRNGHEVRFPEDPSVLLYALLVVLDLEPVHLLVFHRARLADLYDRLHKRHADQGQRLSLTKANYHKIAGNPEQFAGLVDIAWPNPEPA